MRAQELRGVDEAAEAFCGMAAMGGGGGAKSSSSAESATIGAAEIKAVMAAMGQAVDDAEVATMISEIDGGKGHVSFADFQRVIAMGGGAFPLPPSLQHS